MKQHGIMILYYSILDLVDRLRDIPNLICLLTFMLIWILKTSGENI